MMPQRRETFTYGAAKIIQHCAVSGRLVTRVRAYRIGAVGPDAQYPVSVDVAFIRPRKRRQSFFRVYPDNLRYLTIEVDGRVVYDSRADVPCDMEQWAATNAEWEARDRITLEKRWEKRMACRT